MQLFHKSQIDADLADLKKFEMDGSLNPRVSIYNEKLRIAITREIEAMREAYNLLKDEGRVFDANDFEERIDKILNPEKYNIVKVEEVETLLDRFNRYIDGLKTYDSPYYVDNQHRFIEKYRKGTDFDSIRQKVFPYVSFVFSGS